MPSLEGIETYAPVNGQSHDKPKIPSIRGEIDRLKQLIAQLAPSEVEVVNLDEIRAAVHNELTRLLERLDHRWEALAKSLEKLGDSFQAPEQIKVDGIKELRNDVNALKELLASKEFSPSIEVTSPEIQLPDITIPEIKIPDIIIPEQPVPQVTVNGVEVDFGPLLRGLKPLALLSRQATKPLSVRLSDGRNFVKAIQTLKSVAEGQQRVLAFYQNTGGSDPVQGLSATPKFALDDTTTAGTLYIGLADAGAATSAASWRVIKMPTSPLGAATTADGNMKNDNVWDDRASLSYS